MQTKILFVDDDPSMQNSLTDALLKESYQIVSATTLRQARQLFEIENPDLVLLDLKLPDGNGRDFLETLHSYREDLPVLILTAFPDIREGIALMKKGAFDYLVKPFDLQELKMQIRKALEVQGLRDEVLRLKHGTHYKDSFTEFVGDSPAIQNLKVLIQKVSTSESTILISGESGSGKELVARAIHGFSSRSQESLVTANCAAIPETLLEAELFGTEKGAFTGADSSRKGLFELAHRGTLFLDEIGEMPMVLQPKFLRVLENLKIKRLGSSREFQVHVRVIAATNRKLAEMVSLGKFREDLYYRLNVVPVTVPPLRERQEDIAPLANYFLTQTAKQFGIGVDSFSREALELLEQWSWPGNVRELKNTVERIVILHRSEDHVPLIEPHHLPAELRPKGAVFSLSAPPLSSPETPPNILTLSEVEQKHLKFVLDYCRGNKSETARQLGITRNTLKDKMKKYGIEH